MKVGIIGGSGLYNLKELDKVNNIQMDTPFGKPSSNFLTGEIHDIPVVFIPRHGIGHVLLPTEIPFRANGYLFKFNPKGEPNIKMFSFS